MKTFQFTIPYCLAIIGGAGLLVGALFQQFGLKPAELGIILGAYGGCLLLLQEYKTQCREKHKEPKGHNEQREQ